MSQTPVLNTCGCCETGPRARSIWNRPGLPAIDYRIGSFSTFRRSMLEAIAGQEVEVDGERLRPLAGWTARAGDDYGIALLEMWAYLADILTFYQERAANEAFLRTALHRDSILRLAALLDYKLAPGKAATTHLAFTVEEGKQVLIPAGLRVQSVPGQDEKPQKFEVVEAIQADPRTNRIRVFSRPQADNPYAKGRSGGTLQLISDVLASGDKIVVFEEDFTDNVEDRPIVEEKVIDTIAQGVGQAYVEWFPPIVASRSTDSRVRRYRRKFRLFGADAPSSYLQPKAEHETVTWNQMPTDFCTCKYGGGPNVVRREENQLDLEGEYTDIKPGTDLLITIGSGITRYTESAEGAEVVNYSDKTYVALRCVRNVTHLHSRWGPVSQVVTQVTLEEKILPDKDFDIRNVTIYELDNLEIRLWPCRLSPTISGDAVLLQYDPLHTIEPGRQIILDDDTRNPHNAVVRAVSPESYDGCDSREIDAPTVAAIVEANRHVLTNYRGVRHEGAGTFDIQFELERVNLRFLEQLCDIQIIPGSAGRALLKRDTNGLSPDLATSWEVSEDALTYSFRLQPDVKLPDYLAVSFTPALRRSLNTETAVMYGNIAEATHGETVAAEALGDGDAAATFQSFTVQKSPVTFVPEAGARQGAANTLAVTAGDVKWHEAETLYGHGGAERIFTTEVDDEGKMTVRFGDGVTGARLPTGRDNVVATYRQGLGRAGNVKAGSLTTLLDRPLGLKRVTNPLAAAGGADPETLDQARANAPNTVRTFDRVVSLRDFEDAAREFTGVAKARANLVWDGEEQAVFLTVAGDKGDAVVLEDLVAYLDARRDVNRKLHAAHYRPLAMQIRALLTVDVTNYIPERVQADALQTVLDALAFDRLNLGQSIHLSDVYAILQGVQGVIAVDVNRLQYKRAGERAVHGVGAEDVLEHLRVYPAYMSDDDPPSLVPAELAVIESPNTDVAISVRAG